MKNCRLYFLGLMLLVCSCAPRPFDEAAWHRQVNNTKVADLYAAHSREGRFFNPWMPMEEKNLFSLIRWKLAEKQDYTPEEREYLPAVIPQTAANIQSHPHRNFIMWLGHGSYLIRLGQEYWLLDPILSERALIVKRRTPPAISIASLPEIADRFHVIISHNHYDHLDADTIAGLPAGSTIITPLGFKDCIADMAPRLKHVEMDWWGRYTSDNGTGITCLPAQHWSRRATAGTNRSLWASFMIEKEGLVIYFGGDSGYFIGYREFGRKFPAIDYALISTTAYHPRWFMYYQHLNIDEALTAFAELGARYFIPTQWGTFHLGDEPPGYPALDLKRTIAARELNPDRFLLMDVGEIIDLKE